jgi:hypothetical protein
LWWIIILIDIALVIGLCSYVVNTNERKELAKNEGILFPDSASTPPMPTQCKRIPGAFLIFLGTNVSQAARLPHTIVRINGEVLLSIDVGRFGNSIVLRTLKIVDDRNDVIATMTDGRFWVRETNRKSRPDLSTLVVYDHNDIEVLKIRFLNTHAMSIEGVFRNGNKVLRITPEEIGGSKVHFTKSCIGGDNEDSQRGGDLVF